jgi:predicted DNA-binding transcriptional regulator YafY
MGDSPMSQIEKVAGRQGGQCWKLSGNQFLTQTLERMMAPLFVFVVVASGAPLTASMGREHYEIVRALRSLKGKEFTATVNKTLNGFAGRWLRHTSEAAAAADAKTKSALSEQADSV